jgi:hypothetical protein
MSKKRRTELTFETEVVLVQRKPHCFPVYCGVCPDSPQLVTTDEAALLTHVSSREIYRRVEAGQLHFAETADGKLSICPNSLSLSSPVGKTL